MFLRVATLLGMMVLAGEVAAQGLPIIHTEDIGGPYTQDWSGLLLTETSNGVYEVYVKGDGKLGDFFGVLALDCLEPRQSRWLASGGFLDSNAVPGEAVQELRQRFCVRG